MEDQLITFETAKLAKERGFNIPVYPQYYEITEGKAILDVNIEYSNTHYIKEKDYFPAPTQSLLQRWLREVHKIHIHTYSIHLQDGSGYKWSVDVYNLKKLTDEDYIVMTGHAFKDGIKDTFEEALELGLNAALKIDYLWITGIKET